MIVSNPFRHAIVDASTASGVIASLSLPGAERLRYLWVYLNRNTGFFPTDYEAWVRFYKGGELTGEFPAALIPSSNVRIGIASHSTALAAFASTGISGPDVLWFDPNDGTGRQYPIHPMRFILSADEVRLEHNGTEDINALLAVLSMDSPS